MMKHFWVNCLFKIWIVASQIIWLGFISGQTSGHTIMTSFIFIYSCLFCAMPLAYFQIPNTSFHKCEYLFRFSLELWVHFQTSEVLMVWFPVALPVRAAIPSSAAHTDIAHLTARVFFGVCSGKAHELVTAADLSEYAVLQKQGLCVQHLQNDVTGVTEDRYVSRCVRQEGIAWQVQSWKAAVAKAIPLRSSRGQHQHYIMVRCVHAVEISKVEVCTRGEETIGGNLEAQRAVWGVFGREACVELCVAAEEDATELSVDGGAMTSTVVFERWEHCTSTLWPL